MGIDIDGKMRHAVRFPGFETYIPPVKTEEHVEDILTEQEIEVLEKKEMKYQEKKKKRKKKEKEIAKRKRAKNRTKNI